MQRRFLRFSLTSILILCLGLLVGQAAAQEGPVPRDADAELVFGQALEAFEQGDYGMAYRRFRLVYDAYPLNRKTTAAYLMAGKALYRNNQYREAADLLSTLITRYPTSSYLDEARQTRDYALAAIGQLERQPEIVDLGVLLPLQGDNAMLTQALFNGIRLAVEEHNRMAPGGTQVRLVFRDSRREAGTASREMTALADQEGVQAVIGPLYSEEARAAAAAADRSGIVMIAPMATDEQVSEGRHHVFQANPTISMRGRLMARFALRNLRMNTFGVVAGRDPQSLSERMAEAFQEEVLMQGGQVRFYKLLESQRDWRDLATVVGRDTLMQAEALYLPVAGANAEPLIGSALGSLSRVKADVRLLGNAEWHDIPFKAQASEHRTVYTNDFHVDSKRSQVQAFMRNYRSLTGSTPDPETIAGRLAFTGYDVARYLLQHMTRRAGAPLVDVLHGAEPYEGLGIRIDFRNGNVNEALYYFRYRMGQGEQLR